MTHIFASLFYKLASNKRPRWYIVTPDAEDYDVSFWATKNVEVVKARFGEFMEALRFRDPNRNAEAKFLRCRNRTAHPQVFCHTFRKVKSVAEVS